jgi:uncharacterized protein (DUF1778 family)
MPTEAQKKAIKKYRKKLTQLSIRIKNSQADAIKNAAQVSGKSLTQYIVDCCIPKDSNK